MKKHLKIGYLQQHNIADTKTNILRLAAGIKDLANRGAELVVLQELPLLLPSGRCRQLRPC